jgi:D-alanyl-D-alanine carboxypeptidase (penicillin-binding protein 5/6)
LTVVASAGSSLVEVPADATSPGPTPTPPAAAELLVDVGTGRVLFAHNDHAALPPGSLTKMLTAMIVVDWLPPQALVPVSATAAAAYPEKVGMKAGQMWPLDDALQALLIYSANDAAYALAQGVSGSLSQFAATMQAAAAQIGMRDHPIFHDPAGLDGTEGFEGGNRVSAWDLATAARDLMANPELAMIVRMHRLDFTGPDHVVYGLDNQNLYFLDTYPGAIGVKTGLTDAAGFCVAEEAQRGARRMLAIVLNGASSYQTAADLLNKGFATPAGTEPTADELPAVAEPEPVYISHVASHRFANGGLDVSPVAVPEPPSVFHAFGRRLTSSTGVGVECAVGVGVVVVVTSRKRRSRKLRSRRRRPVGAHSRR